MGGESEKYNGTLSRTSLDLKRVSWRLGGGNEQGFPLLGFVTNGRGFLVVFVLRTFCVKVLDWGFAL